MSPPSAPPRITLGTSALMVSTAMAIAYGWTATRGAAGEAALVAYGALERGRLSDGELWRFAAAPFLQPDAWSLVRDGLGVLVAGSLVEKSLGRATFLWVWAISALAGGAAALAGADVVASGSAAAVLGLAAAVLVNLARGPGELAGVLRPRLGLMAGALLLDALGPALVPDRLAWRGLLSADRFALAGGFLGGGAAAMAALAPRPPWRVAVPLAAALLALVAAAAWPRPGPTAFERRLLEARIHDALLARDVPEAERLLADAEQRGAAGDRLAYFRALARAQRGRLEEALELLRPLDRPPDGPFRDEVRRQVAGVAHMLGYRLYTGDGRPQDAAAGLAAFDEACRAGDDEACHVARRIRGGPATP